MIFTDCMKNKKFAKFVAVMAIVACAGMFNVVKADTPPAPTNFTGSLSGTTASLSWTTPGGALALTDFELRYHTGSLTAQNFNIATQVSGVPAPLPGQSQTMQITGLSANTTYYFGIRVYNAMGQPSEIAFATVTSGGGGGGGGNGCETPLSMTGFSAAPVSASGIALSWNTPAQSPLTDFDLRYATTQITEPTFNIATQVSGVPAPLPGQSQTMQITGLSANTTYYFGIKAYNACGSASPFVTTSATTLAGGGGGGGGGTYTPITTVSGANIVINNGANKTYTTAVTLTLNAPSASQMKVSNNTDLSGALWEPYTLSKPWTLTSGDGMKTVYAKYRNSNNVETDIVSDDIRLGDEPVVPPAPTPPTPPPQIIYVPVPQGGEVLGVSTMRVPLDFNTLMVNWGENKKGNYADLNRDGRVNMGDVQILADNWVNISVNDAYIPSDVAARFSVDPESLTLVEGQEVMLVVNVAPGNKEKNYTARMEMYYPTDVLEYKSTTYWIGWIPVVRPEYDIIDEERGRIVKTAGMPEGFDSKKVFAVMKFIAKKPGYGKITIENNTFALNALNMDTFTQSSVAAEMKTNTIGKVSEKMYHLASLITFGESGNLFAFLSAFVFFIIVYFIYLFFGRKKKEDET